MPFSLTVSRDGVTTVVTLAGELDIASAPRLRRTLLESIHHDPGPMLLDLGELTFMDSSGLAVVVAAYKRARQDGLSFALRRPRPAVAKVLAITHVDRVVPIVDHADPAPPVAAER